MTARRAIARAMIASATVTASTGYCESSTSCRSCCICRSTIFKTCIGNRCEALTILGFDQTSVRVLADSLWLSCQDGFPNESGVRV